MINYYCAQERDNEINCDDSRQCLYILVLVLVLVFYLRSIQLTATGQCFRFCLDFLALKSPFIDLILVDKAIYMSWWALRWSHRASFTIRPIRKICYKLSRAKRSTRLGYSAPRVFRGPHFYRLFLVNLWVLRHCDPFCCCNKTPRRILQYFWLSTASLLAFHASARLPCIQDKNKYDIVIIINAIPYTNWHFVKYVCKYVRRCLTNCQMSKKWSA